MQLISAKVGPFRSINDPQIVEIDPQVTVLVGMNEAGKTVFLKALHKTKDALSTEKFNLTDDYPRKNLTVYKRRHEEQPDDAVVLSYRLSDEEVNALNSQIGCSLEKGFEFTVSHRYDNTKEVGITIPEKSVLQKLAATAGLSTAVITAFGKATSLSNVLNLLKEISELGEADKAMLAKLEARVSALPKNWSSVCQHEAWQILSDKVPGFLYFSDYDLLPGKLNLKNLAARLAAAMQDPQNAHKQIEPKHQAVLALLRMADVRLEDFSSGAKSYEDLKAQIESVSINLTDQVLKFWRQNEDLEVEVDIREDVKDAAPFNDGPNLYLRIRNRRHRGVSTPFDQRSRGFIWFFSFLVWFDSVQDQLKPVGATSNTQLVLLLDEPALALHALAQTDFLHYIDSLAETHQVIYTTHSPFMINSDRLHQVRVVEDKPNVGTVISDNLSSSDPKTIFPLQAALGWNIAQNLFIAKQNLLVEGVSELALLQSMSRAVEESGGKGLNSVITIVPVGGLSNVATFISLLNGNGLKFAVLHDYNGKPDQKLESLVQQKLLNKKQVFNFSQFRDLSSVGTSTTASDLEDLLDVPTYLSFFNQVFAKELKGAMLTEDNLPQGDRVVQRIEKYLAAEAIKVRPSPGYNHYAVALAFASAPPERIPAPVIERFASLFDALNQAFK
ncbi:MULTISPECIES: AAA family ATPase [unclassified Pseudomonas]|uniref:AAA family ATPase n=1 Tax=unclassified Pseudomonas TaxID=196821 RepID=UPI001CBE2B1E|nr:MULTISPECIES: AAA family ATPase [unclassified Pseudomonas]